MHKSRKCPVPHDRRTFFANLRRLFFVSFQEQGKKNAVIKGSAVGGG
jgi:hypothetical protein